MLLNSTAHLLRAGSRLGVRRLAPSAAYSRQKSSGGPGLPPALLSNWYNVFGKSNVAYITWIVAGILVAEGITGAGTDMLWNAANRGRTYESVDWTKFVVEDDEEDEDEDDDDEEEDEDDDDDDDDDE